MDSKNVMTLTTITFILPSVAIRHSSKDLDCLFMTTPTSTKARPRDGQQGNDLDCLFMTTSLPPCLGIYSNHVKETAHKTYSHTNGSHILLVLFVFIVMPDKSIL